MDIQEIRRKRLQEWFSNRSLPQKEKSYISQLINGKSPFGERAARRLEATYGMGLGYLDKAQNEDHEGQPDLGPAIQTPLRPVVVVDSADDINPDHDIFAVPRYTVRASAGDGEPVFEIDTKGTPNYCRGGWALENGYKRDKLFSIVARGNSMEPTIPNGASLIVHRQEEVVSGKVHVICRGDECYVKRLIRQMDGSVLVKSENPDYKDVEVQPDDPTPLHVVGLVVSVSFNL